MSRFKCPLCCLVVCWGIDNEIGCALELLDWVFCAGSVGAAICRSLDDKVAVIVSHRHAPRTDTVSSATVLRLKG